MLLLCAPVAAQQTSADAPASAEASVLKSAEELETLVARVALFPDDVVAVVMASSLYPLQVVQAQRFLDQAASNKDLKPNASWDSSVISLLNYPDVVKMMNDDLAWTEELGTAVTNQQKDVLVAIQQLRDKAVATGAIKSDDKVIVETQNDNVVIRPAKQEVTYIPQYDPAILLEPDYVVTQPISYGDPYPSYYYPYAPYWPGFFTGAIWGAAIDWDDWHCWGGDIDIDIGDIDIDRDRFNFDRNRINALDWNRDRGKLDFDRDRIADGVKNRDGNRLDRKQDTGIKRDIASRAGDIGTRDVRRDVQQGLARPDGSPSIAGKGDRPVGGDKLGQAGSGSQRPGGDRVGQGGTDKARPAGDRPRQGTAKQSAAKQGPAKKAHAQRPSSKPAARPDYRPRQPSAMGDYGRGMDARMASQRGRASHVSRGGGGGGPRFASGGRGGGGGGRGRR